MSPVEYSPPKVPRAGGNCGGTSNHHSMSDDLPNDPPLLRLPLSLLHGLQQDDYDTASAVSYSYYSTWSSNYTMSNLPGPGRLLGIFYSRMGLALEQRMAKRANRMALKENAETRASLLGHRTIRDLIQSVHPELNDRACEFLLVGASSSNQKTQVQTFHSIVQYYVRYPSKFLSNFQNIFRRRNEISDAISFSWKQPGVEYSIGWLYWFKLASRCLSSDAGHDREVRWSRFDGVPFWSMDFSEFEEILLKYQDATESLLAIRFVYWYWNLRGIENYVRRRGMDDLVLLKFAIGLVAYCEVYFTHTKESTKHTFIKPPSADLPYFILGMLGSLRDLDRKDVDELLSKESHLMIWAEVFKLHQIYRSYALKNNSNYTYPVILKKRWKDLCESWLPNPEHARLRDTLAQLEDIYGRDNYEKFPPTEGSFADDGQEAQYVVNLSNSSTRKIESICRVVVKTSMSIGFGFFGARAKSA
ncbi:hypothetical protein SCHPADRAFT_318363 [Schizopora paradoxa]|uniref:Uncharacterized protein n=1 Tax=Schizopora paradoxa TaxID=27342 RepID=A0A0H2RXT6_9AGAM|nr:hypothetical protein SCHPADRAFT_318363 [Schizopora paradoxa]